MVYAEISTKVSILLIDGQLSDLSRYPLRNILNKGHEQFFSQFFERILKRVFVSDTTGLAVLDTRLLSTTFKST